MSNDQSSGTTWDPLANGGAFLSNGDIFATFGETPNKFASIRSNNFKTSGSYMVVCQIAQLDSVGGWMLGVGSRFAPLNLQGGATNDSCSALIGSPSGELFTYTGGA